MAMKAPPGKQFVKNPKTGKYRLVPIKGYKKPVAKKATGDPFVQNEINRQIEQDKQLTQFTDNQTGDIAKLMAEQSNAAASVAGQYAPVTPYVNPTLDANAQARVATDVGLTNAVNQDQSRALGALIAQGGSAATNLAGNMRAAGQVQHRDYARHVQGLKPALEERRREELRQAALQQAQMDLAKNQFGLQVAQAGADNAYRDAALSIEAASAAEAAKPKKTPGKYGTIDKKYDGAIDEVFNTIIGVKGNLGAPVDPKNPEGAKVAWKHGGFWRDGFAFLRARGLAPTAAAFLMSTWAKQHSPETFTGSNPYNIKQMLSSRKVPLAVQKKIITQQYGAKGWALAQKKPVKPTKPTQVPANNGSISVGPGGGTVVVAV